MVLGRWAWVMLVLLVACVPKQVKPVAVAPEAVDSGPGLAIVDAGEPDAGAPLVVDAGVTAPRPPPSPITATRAWSTSVEGVGSSSPRVVDLTGDGVPDVVIGGGVQGQRGFVYALDGKSGKLLWMHQVKDEIYATPALVDVNRDGTPDAIIGGRDFDGTAVSGKNGKVLWTLRKANPKADIPKRNFNGATLVPDRDGDGLDDLVFTQGGSYDDTKRLPGRVMVVSSASGKLLDNFKLPNDREIYCMPALIPGTTELVVGSGGETLPGHLYRYDLAKHAATWELASTGKGFIASPLLHDFAGDGKLDVVASIFEGTFTRIDGATGKPRWSVSREGFESYASPAVGDFGGASAGLDAVTSFNQGTFPDYRWRNVILWVDGETGELIDEAQQGVFASASPVVVDVDGDGLDETFVLSMDSFTAWEGKVFSTLVVFDGAKGKARRLELMVKGAGAATPHVSDLDGDGKLDLVLAYLGHVERYVLDVPGAKTPRLRWNGFRGANFDGVAK